MTRFEVDMALLTNWGKKKRKRLPKKVNQDRFKGRQAKKKKPVVIENPEGDSIGIRHMMYLSLSYDHRVVDGALGGSFLKKVAEYLEGFDINQNI